MLEAAEPTRQGIQEDAHEPHASPAGWPPPPSWSDADTGLSAHEVERRVLEALRIEDVAARTLAHFLADLVERNLYQACGYATLALYAEQRLGRSAKSVLEYARVGRALGELPELDRRFRDDVLGWSQVRELTRVAVPETARAWGEWAAGKSAREVSQQVRRREKGDLPSDPERRRIHTTKVRLGAELNPVQLATWEAFREAVEQQQGGRVSDTELVLFSAHLGFRALTGEELTRRPPNPELDPRNQGAPQPEGERDVPTPKALRKQVLERDGRRCVCCESPRNLSVHHMHWRRYGGRTRPANLVALCEECHSLVHDRFLILRGPVEALEFLDSRGAPLGERAAPPLRVPGLAELVSGGREAPRGDRAWAAEAPRGDRAWAAEAPRGDRAWAAEAPRGDRAWAAEAPRGASQLEPWQRSPADPDAPAAPIAADAPVDPTWWRRRCQRARSAAESSAVAPRGDRGWSTPEAPRGDRVCGTPEALRGDSQLESWQGSPAAPLAPAAPIAADAPVDPTWWRRRCQRARSSAESSAVAPRGDRGWAPEAPRGDRGWSTPGAPRGASQLEPWQRSAPRPVTFQELPATVDDRWWRQHRHLFRFSRSTGELVFESGFAAVGDPVDSATADPEPSSGFRGRDVAGSDSDGGRTADSGFDDDCASGLDGGPASGRSGDPGSGLSDDPDSGLSGDPASGLSVDPASGLSVDPASGLDGDPAPGLSGDPASGLESMVGQDRVRRNLSVAVRAALASGEGLGHVLLYGPAGLGKTSLARALASELGGAFHPVMAPLIRDPGVLLRTLTSLRPGAVVFLDEIHGLPPRVVEVLYDALENRRICLTVRAGWEQHSLTLELAPFTLVAATTEEGGCWRRCAVASPTRSSSSSTTLMSWSRCGRAPPRRRG